MTPFLAAVAKAAEPRGITIPKGKLFWRAQLGGCLRERQLDEFDMIEKMFNKFFSNTWRVYC